MAFSNIEEKHFELIQLAKKYMNKITDKEHDINHMNDVVEYTKKILNNIDEKLDTEACIIGAYWHDVGRIKQKDGHEKLSSEMLTESMKNLKYDEEFIKKCYDSIEFHKWNMTPKTIEGLVIKDADKLAWLGKKRWESCINNNQRLDEIMNLLPKLRNEILYFDCSKKIYDKEIIELLKYLYDEIYNK